MPTPLLCHGVSIENAAPVDEEAVDHGSEAERELDVIQDELIGDRAAETVAPALFVEPKQMIAIGAGAVDPELADHAVGQRLVHRVSVVRRPPGFLCREENLAPACGNVAMQRYFDKAPAIERLTCG